METSICCLVPIDNLKQKIFYDEKVVFFILQLQCYKWKIKVELLVWPNEETYLEDGLIQTCSTMKLKWKALQNSLHKKDFVWGYFLMPIMHQNFTICYLRCVKVYLRN